jgi:hypothetical protein
MRSAKSFAYRGMPVTIRHGGEFDPFFYIHHMGRRVAHVVPSGVGTYSVALSYGLLNTSIHVADHAPTAHKAIMAAVIIGVQENGEIAGTEGIRSAVAAVDNLVRDINERGRYLTELMDRLRNGGVK